MDVDNASRMSPKVKRTYNLSDSTIERVQRLAERPSLAGTQDGIVELAVERLYLDVLGQEEADLWAAAREDEAFREEAKEIARDFRDEESWPA
jgi:hypothetical protein